MVIAILFVLISITIGCIESINGDFASIDWEYTRSRIGQWMEILGWAGVVWFVFGEISEVLRRHWWSPFLIYYLCVFAKSDTGLLHELAFPALACFAGFFLHHWLSKFSG